MFLMARQKLGLHTAETIMIGDTLETDIKGAVEIGIQAYLVLSGSTHRGDLDVCAYRPTRIFDSIAGILTDYLENEHEPGHEAA
jgi:NagD protein